VIKMKQIQLNWL